MPITSPGRLVYRGDLVDVEVEVLVASTAPGLATVVELA